MPSADALALFVVAALALLAIPGPAVVYVVTRSVDQGRAAGFASVLGVATGSLVHSAAAAVGLSALLMRSATAYTAVKWLGAAYLVFLGVRRLLTKESPFGDEGTDRTRRTLTQIYRQGVVVNVLNPKTALFFLSFLPQFVNPARGSVALQLVFLGVLFALLGICSDGCYALVASRIGGWLKRSTRAAAAQRWITGTVYASLGITTALATGKPAAATARSN